MDTLKNSMGKETREKKTKATHVHTESEWLRVGPEFKELHGHFESLKIRQNTKNELIDLLEEDSSEIWGFYHDTDTRDFETCKKGFLEKLKYDSIKGLAKIEAVYDQEIQEVRETYNMIVANVERVSAKQGVAYPEELGSSVGASREEETQFPAVAVDKGRLRLPSGMAGSK